MINFFRRIRKQFSDDNKPLKYLRYALGEIVLVVVGIFIALQINNWNEARSQNAKLHKFLGALVKELSDDKENLRHQIVLNSFRVHSVQRLLRFAGLQPIDFGGPNIEDTIPYDENIGLWKGPLPDSLNIEFIATALTWAGKSVSSQSHTNPE